MDHLNAKNLMSYLNLPNSILCVNTHSPCGKTRIIPSTQFPHQLDMTGHLNVTNFMRHLNVTNSLIYLNTHNLRGKIHITSSTSAEVPISSPTWLNGSSCVTNFMWRLNVTNSIFYLPTHRLRGKMRIKSSTAGKVPVSSPTWHEGSSKCHEVYEASKCHELKSHELNYASTYPQATREDAYKVINSCRSANLLPTDSMYASWIQVHTIRVYVCIHIQPCTHVHICICICVQSCTHVHMCMFIYISRFNLLPTDSMYASWIQVHTICVYLCIHIQSCTHVHICICICVQSCTHVHMCMFIYVSHFDLLSTDSMYAFWMQVYTWAHTYYLCTYVYTFSHLYIHKLTCSLECAYIQSQDYVSIYINLKIWIYIDLMRQSPAPWQVGLRFGSSCTPAYTYVNWIFIMYIYTYVFVPLHESMYIYGYFLVRQYIYMGWFLFLREHVFIYIHMPTWVLCIDVHMRVYVYI